MQGFQTSRGGNGPGSVTSISGNLSNSSASTTINLAASSNQVKISNYDSTNPLYVSFSGPATTSNYQIAAGKDLNLAGSGGIAYWTFYVFATTNLSAGPWTPVATNQFDSSGHFTLTFTNAINLNPLQMFYRLQLQ